MEKNPYVVPLGKVFLDIVSFTFYVARVAFAMKSIIRTQMIVFSLVTRGVKSSIQTYRAEKKSLYVVVRYFFHALLNFFAWPFLAVAYQDLQTCFLSPVHKHNIAW